MSDLPSPLFDKIINVKLFTLDTLGLGGEGVVLGNGQLSTISSYIQCPKVGRKPTINIRGSIWATPILSSVEIRITNLFTGDIPLDAYKYLKIEAGYASQLLSSIEGEVNNAYNETPGPDGVTVFEMLLGYFSKWTNTTWTRTFPAGASYNSILTACAEAMGMTLDSSIPDSRVSAVSWSFSELVSRSISSICRPIGLNVYPDGSRLRVYDPNKSTDKHHVMRYFTSAPTHDASGFSLIAPWNPEIRPGDILDIDTRFMRQTYGGAQVGTQDTSYVVQTIDFDFSTTDETNNMKILTTTLKQAVKS